MCRANHSWPLRVSMPSKCLRRALRRSRPWQANHRRPSCTQAGTKVRTGMATKCARTIARAPEPSPATIGAMVRTSASSPSCAEPELQRRRDTDACREDAGGECVQKSTQPCAKMATGCEVLLLLVATTTTTIPTKPIHIPASASTSPASLTEARPRPVSVTSIHLPLAHLPKQRKG